MKTARHGVTVMAAARGLAAFTVVGALALVGGLGSGTASASPTTYKIVDLGNLGGPDSYAYDLNNNAELAGQTTTLSNSNGVWFHWRRNEIDSGYSGTLVSAGLAVNDLGHVVGYVGPVDGSTSKAFTYDTTHFRFMGGLGGTCNRANDVNNKNYAVGVSYLGGNCATGTHYHAVLWMSRRPHNLGTLVGRAGNSSASAINYKDMIAGTSDSSTGHPHAFFWRAGHMYDRGVLAGAVSSNGIDINPTGDMVGKSTFAGGNYHAFFIGRKARTMVDLGSLGGNDSAALGIGRSDEVVGEGQTAGAVFHAFIWANGTISDLNSLVTNGTGWVLTAATAMNDYGRISGYGTFGGNTHAFLLIPQG